VPEADKVPEVKNPKEKASQPEVALTDPWSAAGQAEIIPRILKGYQRYLVRRAQVEPLEVAEIFLSSMTRLYDPHSVYMAPDTEADFDMSMSLQFSGIGARLSTKDSYSEIVSLIHGGPAEKDGRLKPGDQIVAVAQAGEEPIDLTDMPLRKVVKHIRGKKGTTVFLTVKQSATGQLAVIDITRGVVKLEDQAAQSEIKSVPIAAANPGVGANTVATGAGNGRALVISLPSFYADFKRRRMGFKDYKSSTRDIRELIEKAVAEGQLDGVVLDLRWNGGGALDEAIGIAGLFFAEGPVVQVRDARGRVKKRYDPSADVAYGGPLVVLVDKSSASASEIVAAALQDYGRAVVIGDASTHGKGTVQSEIHLEDRLGRSREFRDGKRKPGAVKYTIAKFYRINGGSTQLKGVVPDLILPSYTDHMDLGEAKLPNALPWDEIQPANYKKEGDVSHLLPELKERMGSRLAKDEEVQQWMKSIRRYGERRKMKEVPLERKQRETLRREDEEWGRKMREAGVGGRRGKKGAKESQARDFVLDEALHVIADINALQSIREDVGGGPGKTAATPGDELEDELP
ncbi:MAG: carboxy terminal-processing peptidase, partial [Lentisphaeria bacterium]|nr:carboxy terminal-processing peptidase [Lentisphaeria bacterium]